MKARKTPSRTCVACGRETAKGDLVRVVRDADGDVLVDPTGRAAGRGAYLCPDRACFEAAARRKRIAPALRATITEDDVERLRHEFEGVLETRTMKPSGPGR